MLMNFNKCQTGLSNFGLQLWCDNQNKCAYSS